MAKIFGEGSSSKTRSKTTTDTSGNSSSVFNQTERGNSNVRGGSSTTGMSNIASQGGQSGTTSESWGSLPAIMARLGGFLNKADSVFLGDPMRQTQGDIAGGGREGLLNLLNERAATVLGGNNRDAGLKKYAADDIERRVNRAASARGAYGMPVHQGVMTRELGNFNRGWEQDKYNRDVQGLSAGASAAQAAQNLEFGPMKEYASILGTLGQLGGQRQGANDMTNYNDQQTNSQQNTANWQDTITQMITNAIEEKKWRERQVSRTKSQTDSAKAGFEF